MTKLKIFSLIKRPDACFYYRILNPHKQLARQFGWEIKYNTIDPLPHNIQAGVPSTVEQGNLEGSLNNLIDCHGENIDWADLVVMQRPTCDHHLELMRHIQKVMKKPVVYEADDNYIDVPKWNQGHEYFTPRAQYIKDMIAEADALTVTTEGLGDIYRPLRRGRPIYICPNSIDLETLDDMPTDMTKYEVQDRRQYFQCMKQMRLGQDETDQYKEYIHAQIHSGLKKQNVTENIEDIIDSYYKTNKDIRFSIPNEIYNAQSDGKVMIAWGGSPTHKQDLAVVTDPLMEILADYPEYQLGMVGFIHGDWLKKMRREQLWQFALVPVRYYYSLYKQVNMTVGLAPVNRDSFNKGKSNLKILEYMALGTYAIGSDFVTYAGKRPEEYEEEGLDVPDPAIRSWCGPDVPLCSTGEDWKREILKACQDEELRFEVTQRNRQFIEDHYDMYNNVKYWKDCYESVT